MCHYPTLKSLDEEKGAMNNCRDWAHLNFGGAGAMLAWMPHHGVPTLKERIKIWQLKLQ